MALSNEKIRTPDVVEIQDVKIYATSSHPIFGTLSGYPLDIVLKNISTLTLTPGEKQALAATATFPSSGNPVVLKLDVPVYYKMDDFGQIKDSVATFADLPLDITPTGDVTLGFTTILNVFTSVVVGQNVSGLGIPLNAYVVSVSLNSFEINLAATASGLGVSLSIYSDLGDVRPVLDENSLYRWDGLVWNLYIHTGVLDHTMLLSPTMNADLNTQHISLTNINALNHNAHIHGFYFDPSNVDIVLDVINIAHNFVDNTPVTFHSMGTLPGGIFATTYYIINSTPTSFQVSLAPAGIPVDITSPGVNLTPTGITGEPVLLDSHFVSNKILLDQITASGSGAIITNAERSLIPTPGMVGALLGTVGTPSNINRYVTDYDPRINTLRNPYATIGVTIPPCSYPGNTLATFTSAIEGISNFSCSISVGNPAVITASTNIQDGDVVYFSSTGTLPDGILSMVFYYAVNTTPTQFNISAIPAGPLVITTSAGSGDFHVGGNNWQVKTLEVLPGNYTLTGPLTWSLQEDGWLLECLPVGGATITCTSLTEVIEILPPGIGKVTIRGFEFILTGATPGILLARDYCIVEDCTFTGSNTAVNIQGDYSSIRRCTFSGSGILVTGNFSLIDGCTFLNTTLDINALGTTVVSSNFDLTNINIQVGATYTSLNGNTFSNTGTVTDAGSATKFIERPLSDIFYRGTPLGQKKSIGFLGSEADYRGNTDAIFTTALADPLVTEIDVLPGTYNFSSSVTIPVGKSVTCSSGVFIISDNAFILSDDTSISNITFNAPNAVAPIDISSCQNVRVLGCKFQGRGVSVTNSTNIVISGCLFSGVNGISLVNSTSTICDNTFFVGIDAIISDATSNACLIKDNKVIAGAITLFGNFFIIRGNFFLAGIPNKLNLVDSIWQGNYPVGSNNYLGKTYIPIGVGKYLDSYTPGCALVEVNGFGALSFIEIANSSASTMAVPIPFILDNTFNFTTKLSWTSVVSSGDAVWQITVVFFDRLNNQLGIPQVVTVVSSRTHISPHLENSVLATFTSYGGIAVPTNFSVDITRLPLDPSDTLLFSADLTHVETTFRSL